LKGAISKTGRDAKENQVPGPGAYFSMKYGIPEQKTVHYSFNRKVRNTDIKEPKKDYDGAAYYKLKSDGNKKIYAKGFTLKATCLHVSEDHHKKHFPGVGRYQTKNALEKTTQCKEGPSFLVPQVDCMSLETIKRYYAAKK
jgi:hypothetical protein